MEILQNQGTFTTAFDQAVMNNILCQFKNGRVKGWLNELEVFEISSSAIGIKSGYAIIEGRVIVNRETLTVTNAVMPSTQLLKHIIIRVTAIDNLTSTVHVINRDYLTLTQDNVKYNEAGVYEVELCRYNLDLNGISGLIFTLGLLPIVNQDSINNLIGPTGRSAYEIWIDKGNIGSEEDFIEWLRGEQGPEGPSSVGKSAFEIWLDQGHEGNEDDFLTWLRGIDGEDGIDGVNGKSAYDLWLDAGNIGTEDYFLFSLKELLSTNNTFTGVNSFSQPVVLPSAIESNHGVTKGDMELAISNALVGANITSLLRLGKIINIKHSIQIGNNNFTGFKYGNNIWVAITSNGLLATSINPEVEWVANDNIIGGELTGIEFDGVSTWVAVGSSGKILVTTNPAGEWTLIDGGFENNRIRCISFNWGKWIAAGDNGKLAIATDPTGTWTHIDSSFDTSAIYSIKMAADYVVIVGQNGKIATSVDWPTYSTFTLRTSGYSSTDIIHSIDYGNGYWVTVGSWGKIATATHPDSIWTLRSNGQSITSHFLTVSYGNNIWKIGSYNGKLIISSDPTSNWILIDHSFNSQRISESYYSNGYTIIGAGNTLNVALASY